MRYPEFLKEHGTIGFIAPSFGCTFEPYLSTFAQAKNKFHEMGFSTIDGPNCYEEKGIGISNTPEKCGKEINEMYCSSLNDVLISCGGGELMCEDLNYVDFRALKAAKPKWFMGYSDNTNLTFLLATLCDTAAIYGPCVSSFGMKPWHPAIEDAFEMLCGRRLHVTGYDTWEKESLKSEEQPLVPYHTTEKKILHLYEGEQSVQRTAMQGRLIGGCMDCLSNLVGTQFDKVGEFANRYKEDGIIWFLESCDLNVMSIRRAVWQMKNAGWFAHVKGFLIGRPLQFGQEMMGLDQYHAVTDVLAEFQVPIIMDADLGHLPPMMPLITGSFAHVSANGNEIGIKMELR